MYSKILVLQTTVSRMKRKLYYSGYPIIRTPIIQTLDYPNAWTSPCFWQQREKHVAVTGVVLQEKANLLY